MIRIPCAAVLAASALLLGACSQELILEGERIALRAPFGDARPSVPENRAVPISLPAPAALSEWTHRLATPGGSPGHVALAAAPERVWSANIGQGESRRHRITADPIVAGGRVFALDSQATVTAVNAATGAIAWQRDLTPAFGRRGNASGGGLAFGGGRLFVTTAFGQIMALDPETGAEIWSFRFDAPATAAPSVIGDRVYVVAADSSGWAFDTLTGRIAWQLPAMPSPASMVGGARPAAAGGLVVLPYPSGEVAGVRPSDGTRAWSSRVAGSRPGQAYAGVRDITGDPVVVGNTVYVASQSGRIAAFDAQSGLTRWNGREGAYSPVWPVGGNLFLISDIGELVRLDAASGDRIWGVALPYYTRDRESRRAEVHAHYGPVVAGGRVIVLSNDGLMRSFDPVSGAQVSEQALPRPAASNPAVVNGVLYFVSTDGQLHALR